MLPNIVKNHLVPIVLLGVEYDKIENITAENLLDSIGFIFDGIVQKDIWAKFNDLKQEIASVLANWQNSSIKKWSKILTRRYQLSSEEKYLYTPERTLLLLCRNYSPNLQKLPLEVIKLICSFLPVTMRGCWRFGVQIYTTGKWSWESKYVYLLLDPSTFEFEYASRRESTNWSYEGMRKTKATGTWEVDSQKTEIIAHLKKLIYSKKDSYADPEDEGTVQEIQEDVRVTLQKDLENGIKVRVPPIGEKSNETELPELSLWHLEEIRRGKKELRINC